MRTKARIRELSSCFSILIISWNCGQRGISNREPIFLQEVIYTSNRESVDSSNYCILQLRVDRQPDTAPAISLLVHEGIWKQREAVPHGLLFIIP